jgi:hypothetical protein
MAARSLGKKDSVSEAAVAGLSLLKVWINIFSLDKKVTSGKYTEPQSPEKYLDLRKMIQFRIRRDKKLVICTFGSEKE